MALLEKTKSNGAVSVAAPEPAAPPIGEIADEIRRQPVAPAESAADPGDILPIDSLVDWLENGLTESIQRQASAPVTAATLAPDPAPSATAAPWAPRQGEAPVNVSGKSDPLAGRGIEIGVRIYVEILEAVSSALGQWYAKDDATEFNFNTKLKERYKEVAAFYANSQNIQVSPGFLFGAFTILLLSQSAIKAHKRRNELLKIESFKRKTAAKLESQAVPSGTRQMSLFPDSTDSGDDVFSSAITSADIPDRARKTWKIDPQGYYTHTPEGDYLKQSDRRARPSPAMQAFIDTFKARYNRAPENKEVKQYLKTV